MNKDPVNAMMAGGMAAVLLLPLSMHPFAGVIFGWFLAAPLFWAAGAFGHKAGTISAMVAATACGLLMGPVIAFAYGLSIVFPAWYSGRQILLKRQSASGQDDWYPLGEVLAKATVFYAALLVAVLASIVSGLDQGVVIYDALGQYTAEQGFNDLLGTDNQAALESTMTMIQSFGPGMGVAMLVVMCAVSALVAQAILVRQGRNIRPGFDLTAMQLPIRLGWLLVISGLLALVASGNTKYIASNVFIVLMAPYFLLGVAVVYRYAAGHRQRKLILIGFYVLMILIGWVMVLIAGLGMFESWNGNQKPSRNRISGGSTPDSGEKD